MSLLLTDEEFSGFLTEINQIAVKYMKQASSYLLFCPKCKQEMLIDLQQFHIILLKQSDAKTQS